MSGTGRLRIISGTHRGRRLRFPDRPGLRPTTDRVRETAFNWLASRLPGCACLDPFAGSGALAFEALSRGAASAVLVERDRDAVRHLEANARELGLDNTRIIRADALRWLTEADLSVFDGVFLDPPFDGPLLEAALNLLEAAPVPPGWVYLEESARGTPAPVPERWTVERERTYGDTRFRLVRTNREPGPAV